MTGILKGFWGKVAQRAPHMKFIHRQAIAATELEPEVYGVLQDVINVINFINPGTLHSTMFTILSNKLGSDHEILYLAEVSWLSSSKVLKRVVKLKDKLCIFLLQNDKCSKYVDIICDDKWLSVVCYLAVIFKKINKPNDRESNYFSKGTCAIWRQHFENGYLEIFLLFHRYT